MTALKRLASAVVHVLLEHAARADVRRGVAVAEDDVVHAVRGRAVVLDRPAVRAAVERRRVDDHAAAACRRCPWCRRCRPCRSVPPRPAVPVPPPRPAALPAVPAVPPRRPRCRRCRSCRRPLPALPPRPPLPSRRCRWRPAPPAAARVRRWCPPPPALPAVPAVPAAPPFRRWRSSPRSRSCPAAPGPLLPPLPDGVVSPSLWTQRRRRADQPRARGMRNEGGLHGDLYVQRLHLAMGVLKKRARTEKHRQACRRPDIHLSGSVHAPIASSRLVRGPRRPACWLASRRRLRAGGGCRAPATSISPVQ